MAYSQYNKYKSVSCVYNGIAYHSRLEAAHAKELDLRLKAGDIKSWKRQVKIPLDVNGTHIANYYIDFVLTYPDGREEYVEVKGFETAEWRLKWKLAQALYPQRSFVLVR